jgi:hypothetical protein
MPHHKSFLLSNRFTHPALQILSYFICCLIMADLSLQKKVALIFTIVVVVGGVGDGVIAVGNMTAS